MTLVSTLNSGSLLLLSLVRSSRVLFRLSIFVTHDRICRNGRDEVASPVRVSAAVVSSVTTLESALLPPRIRRFRTPAAPFSTVILAVEQYHVVLVCTRVMLRAE